MKIPVSTDEAVKIASGLAGLINIGVGPTEEQRKVFQSFCWHILRLQSPEVELHNVLSPDQLAETLPGSQDRRIFIQMAIMLELCRHPATEAQLNRLEEYASALNLSGPQLDAVRDLAHKSAVHATADFLRVYDKSIPELTERQFQKYVHGSEKGSESLWQQLRDFESLPSGTLGREFFEFYQRNELSLPSSETPNPGYYVAHDMNHVIAGYEPTGPGEIALGIFKLMMNDSEANWMGSMVNFLIHEVGLFKHAKRLQFVPYGRGGEPYHGLHGSRGAMTMRGAPELVAEAWERGAACRADFAAIDHLAIAHIPLVEIRSEYHVIPLENSMRGQEDASLWPQG